MEILANGLTTDLVRAYLPLILIHITPQTVQGVSNARFTVRIRHDIDSLRSVDYTFSVHPKDLDVSLMYIGSDVVDTVGVMKGLVVGNLGIAATRTTAAKRKARVDVSGLPEDTQAYVEVPSVDHPLLSEFSDRVLSSMGPKGGMS
jgi:hypothetical protein